MLYPEVSLSNVSVPPWLTCVIFVTGVCANAYLVWSTTRPRFAVKWETFRLILRYTSAIDSVVLLSCAVARYTGRDTASYVQCKHFGSGDAYNCVCLAVGYGVTVVIRQTIMLFMFKQEVVPHRQNRMRVVKLLRDVAIAGCVSAIAVLLLDTFAPFFALRLCYVVADSSSSGILLFLVPIVASFVLGVIVVGPSPKTCTDNGLECADTKAATADDATRINISDKSMTSVEEHDISVTSVEEHEISMSSVEEHDITDQVSDSRWNRFIIILNATYISWFVLATSTAFGGLLTHSVDVDALNILTGCTGVSLWSAYSVTRRWR